MKKVLSIIVSYNFEPWLDKCLSSLLTSLYPTDVLVIDNASQDHTVAIIQERYPQVTLIRSAENLGFGGANNLGFKYAIKHGYDYVFLVNQDAWISPDCINQLLTGKYPKAVGILSPMHYDGTAQALDAGFAAYTNTLDFSSDNITAEFINAAFWLIHKDILKQLGGFSSIFYHYGEDSDYVNRLHYHGYRLGINPKAIAYHDRQGRVINRTDEQLYKSEFVYFLTVYANINFSFLRAFAYAIFGALKKALQAFPNNSSRCRIYFKIAMALLRKTGPVRKTRYMNKQVGKNNWLN